MQSHCRHFRSYSCVWSSTAFCGSLCIDATTVRTFELNCNVLYGYRCMVKASFAWKIIQYCIAVGWYPGKTWAWWFWAESPGRNWSENLACHCNQLPFCAYFLILPIAGLGEVWYMNSSVLTAASHLLSLFEKIKDDSLPESFFLEFHTRKHQISCQVNILIYEHWMACR